ncbi:MAG TPA: hypothetical protein PLO78_03805 [Candidatus Omnitrophota bacterium]|nr:hypothetical protein [Candidatus Omnitrophota bacterium]
MDKIANFGSFILSQWTCSLSLYAAGYLFVFLLIRHLFMHSMIKQTKSLNSKWLGEIKKLYVRRWQFGLGWIIFLVSLFLFAFLYMTANIQKPSLYELGMAFMLILMMLFAMMAHLIALATCTLLILKQIENNQMTL